jgi:hypothetical protein
MTITLDEDAVLEARDLRKLMVEVAKRMNTLNTVHHVQINFNIAQNANKEYKLTEFTAIKHLDVDAN